MNSVHVGHVGFHCREMLGIVPPPGGHSSAIPRTSHIEMVGLFKKLPNVVFSQLFIKFGVDFVFEFSKLWMFPRVEEKIRCFESNRITFRLVSVRKINDHLKNNDGSVQYWISNAWLFLWFFFSGTRSSKVKICTLYRDMWYGDTLEGKINK